MISRPFARVPAVCLLIMILVSLVMPAWAAFEVPPYQGYVNDLGNVLSSLTEYQITQIATELDQKAHVQIAVLTVPSLEGTPIESASLQVARTWGVGYGDKNTGLLIFLSTRDRKARTEIGYGLEGIITDGLSGEIQDTYMVPYFKDKDYNMGILNGVIAYALEIAKDKDIKLQSLQSDSMIKNLANEQKTAPMSQGNGSITGTVLIFGIIIMLILLQMLGILPFFLLPMGGGRHRGGPFGGFSGGSFGGGDFGGFGGGGFGGGGSTRSW